jgi:transposase
MSLQTRGHRRLWLTSKVKVAVCKRFFLSFSTILFTPTTYAVWSMRFVEHLDMKKLGFERAQPEDTGRPGYDPRALLKPYMYGYLNQIRSSRGLEAECRRNVEVMWLLERLYPDHKSIAEFRRVHRDAVTSAMAELVRFAKSCGLIRGE